MKDNTSELKRLKVSQEAIENSKPVTTTSGQCDYHSIYYDDGKGNFSVASRLSDGSWRCITYNLADLQNYESEDGNISVKTDPKTGQRTTTVKSTDETGATTTTTTVSNPDGSSESHTEGGYGKMIIGPTNDGRQIYGFFDYTDNRQHTDVGRFQTCYLAENFYTHTDGNSYFDGTYRELSASEKAARAIEFDCTRLPAIKYEKAKYNLSLLKSCLRKAESDPSIQGYTCYRRAEG